MGLGWFCSGLKWIGVGVGGLLGILLLLTLAGLAMSGRHVAVVSAAYAAAPERLFDAIRDRAAHPTWRTGLESVRAGEPRDGHAVWIEVRDVRHGSIVVLVF